MMAEAVERIPQHRHCVACSKAHVNDGRYCSDACKENKEKELKKKKKQLILLWVACAAVAIGALVMSLGGFI